MERSAGQARSQDAPPARPFFDRFRRLVLLLLLAEMTGPWNNKIIDYRRAFPLPSFSCFYDARPPAMFSFRITERARALHARRSRVGTSNECRYRRTPRAVSPRSERESGTRLERCGRGFEAGRWQVIGAVVAHLYGMLKTRRKQPHTSTRRLPDSCGPFKDITHRYSSDKVKNEQLDKGQSVGAVVKRAESRFERNVLLCVS
ncbi:hypothetical protein EVAR_64889_1 [Eumeta japonica]|uniref:Uncharacterized protein n=1 Tax=Eumeta variegata TaxID=151549 RepID=A0A4C1ZUN2_EUMVA|nr:hypothetical protein EVAR_64889_1 [Eumeta japonica]